MLFYMAVAVAFLHGQDYTEGDVFGGMDLGGGWLFSEWYGNYNPSQYPWIYHKTHGFQFVFEGENEGDLFLFDSQSQDWWFTSELIYPSFFSFNSSTWNFYFYDTVNPRQFVDLQSGDFWSLEIPSEGEGTYTPLDGWVVSDGSVRFFFFKTAASCIQVDDASVNGVTYIVHASKWQRRTDESSAWTDIPETEENTFGICSYSPTEPGQYRGVAEISSDGEKGYYSSENTLTVEAGTAPEDEAAFNELVVGKRVLSPHPAYDTDFVSPGRFRETEGSDIWTGSYTYRNTGPNTGTVTFNYDDGDRCVASFTFVSTTAGTATYTCNDGESGESNWLLVAISATGAPDLVVQTPSVSDSNPNAGESFTLSAAVRNQGNGRSASTTLRYYRSTDATISTADTEVGTDTVGALTAAGTSDESIDLTAPSTPGTYYYGACVDPVSGESNSQNNCSTAVRVTVTATGRGEDTVTRAEFEASTPTDYVGVTLSDNGNVWGVPEKYTSDSIHGTVVYMLLGTMKGCSFANAEADGSSKAYIKTQQLGSLSNYEPVSVCRKTSRSWNSFAGTRMTHLRFFDESSPTNIREYVYDAATGRYDETIPPAPAPSPASDLMVEGFDLASGNHGPAGIAFANNRFYVVDGGSSNRGRPAKVYVYLASGQREPAADFDLHEDNDWPLAITFANNRFFVPDWRDNKVYAYQTSGQRDSASDFDLDAAQRYDVEGIAFTNNRFYVVDQGDAKVYAYQSSGPRDSASDFNLDSANSSPKGIAFGNDRLYVVDDSNDRIYAYQTSGQRDSASDFDLDADYAEGITFANDALYVVIGSFGYKVFAVKLTDQFPDLLVESPSVSDANPGSAGAFVFSATVRNRGTKAAAATTLRYYRSDDKTISTSDTQVGTDEVGALPVDGTSAETITLTAPSTEGAYYYGACVDSAAEEAETENNCSSAVVVFGGGPFPAYDLEISATLHRPSFATIGISSIAMTVEVTNRGPNASRPAKLRFSRNSGHKFDRDIPVLEPNETRTYERVGVGAAQLGRTTYKVCIEEAPGEEKTSNNCAVRSVTYLPQ